MLYQVMGNISNAIKIDCKTLVVVGKEYRAIGIITPGDIDRFLTKMLQRMRLRHQQKMCATEIRARLMKIDCLKMRGH